ncbi:hypothetical protein [Streptomyces sp. NPDC093598]|uniref:hypothetical protein n=1 Tax=Streptomyces sp. NPDC093598 TaxID=3366046 RepID=UPI00380E3A1F
MSPAQSALTDAGRRVADQAAPLGQPAGVARRYHTLRGEAGRTKAIARRGAYLGLTLGALSFTEDLGLTEPYGPPAVETHFVANTNRTALEEPFDEAAFTEYLLADVEAVQITPPLISERALLDRIADIIADPLDEASARL